jgi:hypothetical protein
LSVDVIAQRHQLLVSQVTNAQVATDASGGEDFESTSAADTVNRGQRDFGVLVIWNIYACDTSHFLTLYYLSPKSGELEIISDRACLINPDAVYDADRYK